MKKKKQTKPTDIIQFQLTPERDAELKRQKDLTAGRLIYERWKHKFINKRKSVDQIAEAVNDLANELLIKVGEEHFGYVINEIINPIIAKLHENTILERFTVKVLIDCPGEIITNGVKSECDWGGLAIFHIMGWQSEKTTHTCPKCGRILKQDDMMLASQAEALFNESLCKNKRRK